MMTIDDMSFATSFISFDVRLINFFIILVAFLSLTNGAPSKGSTKASLKKKTTCVKDCGDNYKPVCAGDGTKNISFGSECVLSNYNCENQKGINDILLLLRKNHLSTRMYIIYI